MTILCDVSKNKKLKNPRPSILIHYVHLCSLYIFHHFSGYVSKNHSLAQAETSWIRRAKSIRAMAINISVERLSGADCTLEVQPDNTIRELKETMKKVFYPGDDEVTRKLRSVDLILDGEMLNQPETTIPAIAEGAKVQVVFSMKPTVECARAEESGCSKDKLFDVKIPDGATKILVNTFPYCHSLVRVTIPNSVVEIEPFAFHNCSSLTSLTIPDSLRIIGTRAFASCISLVAVTIPNSVTQIGAGAFAGCSSLTSVTIPNSVTHIEYESFLGCRALTGITIPDSVTSIQFGAFQNCSSLASVRIPRPVARIGNRAFAGCSSLTSVAIPNVQTRIGINAFDGCRGLPFRLRVKRMIS